MRMDSSRGSLSVQHSLKRNHVNRAQCPEASDGGSTRALRCMSELLGVLFRTSVFRLSPHYKIRIDPVF